MSQCLFKFLRRFLSLKPLQELLFPFAGFAGIRVLAKRQIHARSAGEHRLRMRELTEAPLAVVRAHAGVTGAVERHALDHHVDTDLVDAYAAVRRRLRQRGLRSHDGQGRAVQRRRAFRNGRVSRRMGI